MKTSDVTIAVDGQNMRGRLYLPDKDTNKVAVLFLHGWTGRPNDSAAMMLAGLGYPAMTFKLRGHGDSDGDIHEVSRKDSLDDVLAAYDFFATKLAAGSQIVAVGNSYGGYLATMLSGERPLRAMSLRVPATYPDDGFIDRQWGKGHDDPVVAAWRLQSVPFADNMAFSRLHDFEGKVQIIEAENDELVPPEAVRNYRDAAADPDTTDYHLMKRWPHSLGDDQLRNKQFQTILLDWLNGL